jgi:hypothetical protein
MDLTRRNLARFRTRSEIRQKLHEERIRFLRLRTQRAQDNLKMFKVTNMTYKEPEIGFKIQIEK